jgi:hypothetical protein
VNGVSCKPSGARTRAFRSPHGVVTGDATGSAPAAMSRFAVASLSPTWSASRTKAKGVAVERKRPVEVGDGDRHP